MTNSGKIRFGNKGPAVWIAGCPSAIAVVHLEISFLNSMMQFTGGIGKLPMRYCLRRIIFRNLPAGSVPPLRSEEHTSELQSLMRISYAVFCLKKKILTKKI